jgi:tetratricopeptide (TPR) repeat protein
VATCGLSRSRRGRDDEDVKAHLGRIWVVCVALVLAGTMLVAASDLLGAFGKSLHPWELAALASVAAAVSALVVKPLVGAYVGGWVERITESNRRHNRRRYAILRAGGHRNRLPRVDSIDPINFGVHRSILAIIENHAEFDSDSQEDVAELPLYVSRDADSEIVSHLSRMKVGGGFLLLVGKSCVGKTRTAYETVLRCFPDWSIFRPEGVTSISDFAGGRALPKRTIVWLNELQVFLDSADGSAASVLMSLLETSDSAILIGTVWPEYLQKWRASPIRTADGKFEDPWRLSREVVQLANIVQIGQFTDEERSRARKLAKSDLRIAAALSVQTESPTTVLAAGPALIEKWKQMANPYEKATITAAIACRSLGCASTMPAGLLRDAAVGYLTPTERGEAPADWFEESLSSATKKVMHAAAPLIPYSALPGVVEGYKLSDYLYQEGRNDVRKEPVPDEVWQSIVDHVAQASSLESVAYEAKYRGRLGYAELIYRRAMALGSARSFSQLGELLESEGRHVEAEKQFVAGSEKMDVGSLERLAIIRKDQGRTKEAERYLRQAVEHGSFIASGALTKILIQQNDYEEAEAWCRWRLAREGRVWIDDILKDLEKMPSDTLALTASEIESWYVSSPAMNISRYSYMKYLLRQGRSEEAKKVFSDNEHSESFRGMAWEGYLNLLLAQGMPHEAEAYCRRYLMGPPRESNRSDILPFLVRLLMRQGRVDEADDVCLQAAQGGDVKAAVELFDLRRARGMSVVEARRCIVDAVCGSSYYFPSREISRYVGSSINEIEQSYRQKVASGIRGARRSLIAVLEDRGKNVEVEHLFRAGILVGDGYLSELVSSLEKSHRFEEAEKVKRFGLTQSGATAGPDSAGHSTLIR